MELALALVPLIVGATEHYPKLHKKGKLIASQKFADEAREEFLLQLRIEIGMLRVSIECLINDLTALTTTQKSKLLSLDREQWEDDAVSLALIARLGEETVMTFTTILKELLKSLDGLVSEKSLRLANSDVVSDE